MSIVLSNSLATVEAAAATAGAPTATLATTAAGRTSAYVRPATTAAVAVATPFVDTAPRTGLALSATPVAKFFAPCTTVF